MTLLCLCYLFFNGTCFMCRKEYFKMSKEADLSGILAFLNMPPTTQKSLNRSKKTQLLKAPESIDYDEVYDRLVLLFSNPANIATRSLRCLQYSTRGALAKEKVFKVSNTLFYYKDGLAIIIFGEKVVVKGRFRFEDELHEKLTDLHNTIADKLETYTKGVE